MPLSVSTARIVAFGMPAPDGSLTAPVMSPEEPTPCACTTPVANTRQSKSHPPLIGFISPPSGCVNFLAASNLWPEYKCVGTPKASSCRKVCRAVAPAFFLYPCTPNLLFTWAIRVISAPLRGRIPGTAAVQNANLDAAERQRVIDGAVANLKEHYIYPDIAQKMAEALLVHEKAGDYDAITDGAAFAALLTSQLRNLSNDLHLDVVYRRVPLSVHPPRQEPPKAFGVTHRQEARKQDACK